MLLVVIVIDDARDKQRAIEYAHRTKLVETPRLAPNLIGYEVADSRVHVRLFCLGEYGETYRQFASLVQEERNVSSVTLGINGQLQKTYQCCNNTVTRPAFG